ncbi:hypothetical protein HELRODRAFT_167929 [Helobdella robusta]|uniref:Uncharacterized protein n=1 Tax=Helobdella robusta TaxID=6412 RepID=T1EZZ3_HELRO|nr:hypothetical protein HELRODRAFT_167929 [Helobdella robusta]ESO10082.1 hypothetical protein HELRODRAFT_167929 [Helobdella robusta]
MAEFRPKPNFEKPDINTTLIRLVTEVEKIMKNDVALGFNMVGKKGKMPFGSSKLFKIVYRSVKKNASIGEVTKRDVGLAVAKWLTGARDRDGKKASRLNKSNSSGKKAYQLNKSTHTYFLGSSTGSML